ncbi:MAG: hypothetical protein K6F09_07750 [Clostridiales bacterium]|nr:hypothetical protein [Clostridiales bacterium]
MKKIMAIFLSALMALLGSIAPGLFGADVQGIKEGEWLSLIVTEFGMGTNDYSKTPYYGSVGADDPYFAAVQISYEWGVITSDDVIKTDAYATNAFIYNTLTKAAGTVDLATLSMKKNWRKAASKDAVAYLASAKDIWANKDFSDSTQNEIVADNGVADLSDLDYIIDGDNLLFNADAFKLAAGKTFIVGATDANPAGGAFKALSVTKADGIATVAVEKVALEKAVETLDVEGTVDADLGKAEIRDQNGEVIQQATVDSKAEKVAAVGTGLVDDAIGKVKGKVGDFLANPSISFSVKGIKIKADYSKDTGVANISVGGEVTDGVKLEKYYKLSNIKFDYKYDANLAKTRINEAYFTTNYDLVETTVLQGSYGASVVPEDGKFTSTGDFLNDVKTNLGKLTLKNGYGQKIRVFSFTYPLGPTGLTADVDIFLSISAVGRIEIIVSSNETKGVEILNNKARYISDSTVYDRLYNISGDFQVVFGVCAALTIFKVKIVDVAAEAGVGAYVITTIFNPNTHSFSNVDMPYDVAVEAASGFDAAQDLKFCADVQLYGILRISVCENSILAKVGLSKTWEIFNRSNAVFAELHLENSGIVDQCTYKAA